MFRTFFKGEGWKYNIINDFLFFFSFLYTITNCVVTLHSGPASTGTKSFMRSIIMTMIKEELEDGNLVAAT